MSLEFLWKEGRFGCSPLSHSRRLVLTTHLSSPAINPPLSLSLSSSFSFSPFPLAFSIPSCTYPSFGCVISPCPLAHFTRACCKPSAVKTKKKMGMCVLNPHSPLMSLPRGAKRPWGLGTHAGAWPWLNPSPPLRPAARWGVGVWRNEGVAPHATLGLSVGVRGGPTEPKVRSRVWSEWMQEATLFCCTAI